MKDSLKVAVAGATGYVGLELIKILSKHPMVKIMYLCATKSIGKPISFYDKKITKKNLPIITKIKNINWNKVQILFAALPNGEAQKIAKILPHHVKFIDLSADFRLKDFKLYKKWYGINHKCKNLIKESIYAITEFSKNNLDKYKIISCPGCYPTSVQIPLIPLIKKKMINPKNIIIDSKSGYSGAGKKFKNKFKNVFNSVYSYGVGSHRHMAEMDQELSKISKKKINVSFTPHVIPMFRGILSTMYLETIGNNNAKKVYNFLKRYHKKNAFVKVCKFNTGVNTSEVMHTNYCNISVCKNRKKNKIIIISAIDNLIKGASGQAVQNMNAAFKLKETVGLI
tara:strand:+ start:576 stop:1595 length:1020 start_codon:yes stop_codon:yes gene_type:complete